MSEYKVRCTENKEQTLALLLLWAFRADARIGSHMGSFRHETKDGDISLDSLHLDQLVDDGYLTREYGPYNHVGYYVSPLLFMKAQSLAEKQAQYFGIERARGKSIVRLYDRYHAPAKLKVKTGFHYMYYCRLTHTAENGYSAWDLCGAGATPQAAYKDACHKLRTWHRNYWLEFGRYSYHRTES